MAVQHRPSAPDGLARLSEEHSDAGSQQQQQQQQQQIGSVQSGAQSVQQLQSNLLRPATHPTATLQSAGLSLEGSDAASWQPYYAL